jgi:hypothetical protein
MLTATNVQEAFFLRDYITYFDFLVSLPPFVLSLILLLYQYLLFYPSARYRVRHKDLPDSGLLASTIGEVFLPHLVYNNDRRNLISDASLPLSPSITSSTHVSLPSPLIVYNMSINEKRGSSCGISRYGHTFKNTSLP